MKADSAAPIRVRLLGWLVLAAYGVTYLFLYFYHSSLSAEARSFYWQLYGICLVPLGISVYGTYQSHWIGWRLGIVLMAILPLFLEVAVFIPPNAGILWFGILVVGIANVAVFRRKELRYGMALLGVVTLLAIGIALFHSYTAYLPANVMSHGTMRFGLLSSSIGAATLLAVLRYGEIQKQLHLKEKALMTALAEQQALTAMAEERQREAELRRQEAEAALAEIARLREAESARLRQEAFLSRYEQLMRESYTEPLPAFLRKLLESLSDEVSVLGGVFYLRTEGGWRAAAAYAFPDLVGKEVQNGILHIAASLRVPHLVAPAPAGTPSPKSALIRHKPHAVWYIPFYSESTHETLGVAELLLAKLPSSEETQWVQGLLGRIGTYLWVRLRESSESTPDAQIPSQITTS